MLRKLLTLIIILVVALPGYSKRRRRHKRAWYCVPYEVMPGDSPWRIARLFGVKTSQIYRHGRRVRRLRIGWTVKVCAPWHLAPYFKRFYIVRRGDTLGKIAKKLNVSLQDLKRWNRYTLRRGRYLRVGQRLVYLVRGSAKSSSIGAPYAGKLMNGVQLHSGPGYHVRDLRYAWGTEETIRNIENAIACFRARHPKAPKVVVADISRRYGGRLKRHKSHQSGRDVDIGIFANHGNSEYNLVDHRPRDVNIPLTWDLIRCFIETGKVKLIFLDYPIQARLYKYLKKNPKLLPKGYTLKELLQYPRGRRVRVGLIRHEPGHRSHFHVRFVCPKGDRACRD